jgi:hypothetical protein
MCQLSLEAAAALLGVRGFAEGGRPQQGVTAAASSARWGEGGDLSIPNGPV